MKSAAGNAGIYGISDCGKEDKVLKEINGVALKYTEEGETGSRVLLLHGWGCDISLMTPVADRLKDCHRILIPDFPGHGGSGRPPEPWGVPEYSDHLIRFLKEMDFLPCDVIAHSFGCRICTYIASEHPEYFRRIIMTGAAGIRPQQSEEARKRSAEYRKYKAIAEAVRKVPFLRKTAASWEERLRRKYGSADYNRLDEEMRKTFVKVISLDLTERYSDIQQSTLLVWGDRDTETPLWMGREMEKRIPDSALILLEGGSHFAYLEQIDRFTAIAKEFLKEG